MLPSLTHAGTADKKAQPGDNFSTFILGAAKIRRSIRGKAMSTGAHDVTQVLVTWERTSGYQDWWNVGGCVVSSHQRAESYI